MPPLNSSQIFTSRKMTPCCFGDNCSFIMTLPHRKQQQDFLCIGRSVSFRRAGSQEVWHTFSNTFTQTSLSSDTQTQTHLWLEQFFISRQGDWAYHDKVWRAGTFLYCYSRGCHFARHCYNCTRTRGRIIFLFNIRIYFTIPYTKRVFCDANTGRKPTNSQTRIDPFNIGFTNHLFMQYPWKRILDV